MRKTTIVDVPATTRESHSYTCDLCGREIAEDYNDVSECKVSHESGYRYSDCANITRVEFDVCAECFTAKLIPWFESQGAKPRETDVS